MYIKNNKGFSLIEVLVTVGLIGILVGIAVPSYQGYKKNTIKMAVRADVGNGSKVYNAKYAVDGDYCYDLESVGLSIADKQNSNIYKNKGFYGFTTVTTINADGACNGLASDKLSFVSKGDAVCTGGNGTAPVATWDATSKAWTCQTGWTPTARSDTQGAPAANCFLNTNTFKLGGYSNASKLNTFVEVVQSGEIKETLSTTNCSAN